MKDIQHIATEMHVWLERNSITSFRSLGFHNTLTYIYINTHTHIYIYIYIYIYVYISKDRREGKRRQKA
jgi:hypothetical protein